MAALPPYDGAVLVLGTMEDTGIPLLQAADDPNLIVAYAGYGFWAPAALVKKTKGMSAYKDLTEAPIAPITAEYVDDKAYGDLADAVTVDEVGVTAPAPDAVTPVEPEANAPTPDTTVPATPDPNTTAGQDAAPAAS